MDSVQLVLAGALTRSVLRVALACFTTRFLLWLNNYIFRVVIIASQHSLKGITSRPFPFAIKRRKRLSSLSMASVFREKYTQESLFLSGL